MSAWDSTSANAGQLGSGHSGRQGGPARPVLRSILRQGDGFVEGQCRAVGPNGFESLHTEFLARPGVALVMTGKLIGNVQQWATGSSAQRVGSCHHDRGVLPVVTGAGNPRQGLQALCPGERITDQL